MVNRFTALAAGGLMLGLLGGAPMAFAAATTTGVPAVGPTSTSGVTSGPAAGTPVLPSAAVQKHAKATHHSKSTASAETAGAPGATAKRGTEAGPAPHHHLRTASRTSPDTMSGSQGTTSGTSR